MDVNLPLMDTGVVRALSSILCAWQRTRDNCCVESRTLWCQRATLTHVSSIKSCNDVQQTLSNDARLHSHVSYCRSHRGDEVLTQPPTTAFTPLAGGMDTASKADAGSTAESERDALTSKDYYFDSCEFCTSAPCPMSSPTLSQPCVVSFQGDLASPQHHVRMSYPHLASLLWSCFSETLLLLSTMSSPTGCHPRASQCTEVSITVIPVFFTCDDQLAHTKPPYRSVAQMRITVSTKKCSRMKFAHSHIGRQ